MIRKPALVKYTFSDVLWFATIEALIHEKGEASYKNLRWLFNVSDQAVRKQSVRYQEQNPGAYQSRAALRPRGGDGANAYAPLMFKQRADRLHWLSMIQTMFGGEWE